MDWIRVSRGGQWRAFVNTEMNLRELQNAGITLSSLATLLFCSSAESADVSISDD
jgi:hypothetical protein